MRNILFLFFLLLSSTSFGQDFYNADQIKNGVQNQFPPLTPSSTIYVDASGNLLANTKITVDNSGNLNFTGGAGFNIYNGAGVQFFNGSYGMGMFIDSSGIFNWHSATGYNFDVMPAVNTVPIMLSTRTLDSINAPISNVTLNNHKIVNLADGTNPGDSVNFSQLAATNAQVATNTANISTLETQINGWTLPTTTFTSGQSLIGLDPVAKTTTWGTVGGGGTITLNFNCEFNNGGPNPSTGVIMPATLTVIGNLVHLDIQARNSTIGASITNPAIMSSRSLNPGCIPFEYRPENVVYAPAITHIQSTPYSGLLQIEPTGNITIYRAADNLGFTSGQTGGLGLNNSDVATQTITYSISTPQAWTVTVNSTTNGTITPLLQEWLVGTTESLIFNLNPDVGYSINTATDTCNGGSSGGSIVGNTYVITNVTQNCNMSATFVSEPSGTYTVTGVGTNTYTIPTSDNWITGTTTSLSFFIQRFQGYQLSSITDNCNTGSAGGSLIGNNYVVTTVNQDCSIIAVAAPYLTVAYVDTLAPGSLAITPTSAWGIPNFLVFGFADVTTSVMTAPQINAIVTATSNETGTTKNFLSIGGQNTPYSTFVSTTFPVVITNTVAQINQANAAISGSGQLFTGVDLDLEGAGWTPADIKTLVDGFHGVGLEVSVAPQIFYSGSNVVNSNSPTNLILTAGGGTGNTYGLAVSTGVDYILTQTYNSNNWTIDGNNEASVLFAASASKALANTVQSSCSGPTPLCILAGTKIVILQAVNAGAGGFTIYNPTNAPTGPGNTIPAYDQIDILTDYASVLNAAMTLNPSTSGMGAWSLNNDWASQLYNNTDSAGRGTYSNLILGAAL
jgi:hypothetical protein